MAQITFPIGGGTGEITDTTPTTLNAGIVFSDGSHIQSDATIVTDGAGNLSANTVKSTSTPAATTGSGALFQDASSGQIAVDGNVMTDGAGNLTALSFSGSGAGLQGTCSLYVGQGTPTTASGMISGDGSSLSGDTLITTDGAGKLTAASGVFGNSTIASDGSLVVNNSTPVFSVNANTGVMVITPVTGIPTSDPHNVGQLFMTGYSVGVTPGTLMVSAG